MRALAFFAVVGSLSCAVPQDQRPDDPIVCSGGDLFESTLDVGSFNFTAELVAFADGTNLRELQFADESFVRFTMSADEPALVVGPGFLDGRAGSLDCFGEGCDVGLIELTHVNDGRFLIFGTANALDDADTSREQLADSPVRMRKGTDADVCAAGGPTPALLVVAADDGDVELAPRESARVTIEGAPWIATAGTAERKEFLQSDELCADCPPPGLHQSRRSSLCSIASPNETPNVSEVESRHVASAHHARRARVAVHRRGERV